MRITSGQVKEVSTQERCGEAVLEWWKMEVFIGGIQPNGQVEASELKILTNSSKYKV